MQSTSSATLSPPSFEHHPHVYVDVIQDRKPGGILGKILHNVRSWPIAVRVAAVAMPVIVAMAILCIYQAILPADHIFRSILPIIHVVYPFVGMYEATELMNEAMDQMAHDYSPRARS